MKLWQFRKHLADELRNFPQEQNAATQSYSVVTATLARAILSYLNANDLTVPNGFKSERPEYGLLKVLNQIIHFSTLWQDYNSSPGAPRRIIVYSYDSLPVKDHLSIRLSDYLKVMNRLATDDLFIAPYLLKRTITLMHNLMAKPAPKGRWGVWREVPYLIRANNDLIIDSWDMVLTLRHAEKVEIQPSQMECYEDLFEKGVEVFVGYQTTQDFVAGYGKTWEWTGFNPYEREIAGYDTYCVPVDEIKQNENGTTHALVVPFSVFIDIFKGVQNQLATK